MLLAACVMAWRNPGSMLLACSAGIFGFAISLPALCALQKRAMPLPTPSDSRPLTRVVMDRTICDSTLPLAGFTHPDMGGQDCSSCHVTTTWKGANGEKLLKKLRK